MLHNIRIESVCHCPVKEIVTRRATVHYRPSVFRRFHLIKDESLMMVTIRRDIFEQLDVEQNYITLIKLCYIVREGASVYGTICINYRLSAETKEVIASTVKWIPVQNSFQFYFLY